MVDLVLVPGTVTRREENVQGFRHSLEEGVEYHKSGIVVGENVDVEKYSQSNKQEPVYGVEAVACRLSK
jgi:hypothetical protein